MLRIGITGTIASGKSTTAAMFADAGLPLFSADAAVHAAYRGDAVAPVAALVPEAVVGGALDRRVLAARVAADPALLRKLEAIVHPLVRAAEEDFVTSARAAGKPAVIVEHPLIFETAGRERFDTIIVTTAPAALRRARALARPGMTALEYELLSARQWPDAEKRAQADFIVDSSVGLDAARSRVGHILRSLGIGNID